MCVSKVQGHFSTVSQCLWGTQHVFDSFILLYTWPPCPLTAGVNAACSVHTHTQNNSVHTRGILPSCSSGLSSHSLVLIEIPEAPGFMDNIRVKRMQNRSSEYFPEENGLLAWADLAWPLEQGQNVGIWLREQNWGAPSCHGKMGRCSTGELLHLSWSLPINFCKLSALVCSMNHLFTHPINIFSEHASFVKCHASC